MAPRKLSSALLTSEKQDWTTPVSFLDRVRKVGKIMLDPCSNRASKVGAVVELDGSSPEQDGLAADWKKLSKGGLVFVNWPYGLAENRLWTRKMAIETKKGTEVLGLGASRTSEAWFHDILLASAPSALAFVYKRLKFGNAAAVAPFGSIVPYWGRRVDAFVKAFHDVAFIVIKPKRGDYPFSSVRYSKEERKEMAKLARKAKAPAAKKAARPAKKKAIVAKLGAKGWSAKTVQPTAAPRPLKVKAVAAPAPVSTPLRKVVVVKRTLPAPAVLTQTGPRKIVVPVRMPPR